MSTDTFHGSEGRARTECYEFVRFRDRARMLTFIKRDETRYSVSYAHLHGVRHSRNSLRLEFNTKLVVVAGKRLGVIHRALTDHRVIYLREAPLEYRPDEGETIIRDIQFLESSRQ